MIAGRDRRGKRWWRGLSVLPLASALILSACSKEGDGPITVSVIGSETDFAKPLQRLPDPGAKLILEATAQGLVAFDAGGDILPALAQRWIVEDDGRSYIFRLRRAFWANGRRVTATDVAQMLNARVEALRRMDPEGPLDAVQAIVPMTGEVIEIRLAAPRPYVLQMLAQPQMAILSRDGGTGPYRRLPHNGATLLTPVDRSSGDDDPDEPLPERETRIVRAERASLAIVRFRAGRSALVLGGRFTDLPLLVRADIDRNLVRVDPVQGMLGLLVVGKGDFFADAQVRAAINMAIDRSALPGLFPLGGWTTTERIVPDQLDLGRPPTDPAWTGTDVADRIAQAQGIVANWRTENGDPPAIRIALPDGPGATLLFGLIQRDLTAIGLSVQRVAASATTDLRIVDEVAAYDSALWYLGRIGCAWTVQCSKEADAALQDTSLANSPEDRAARIAQAEALMVANNSYIPLGAPIRWSLVSRRLDGFLPSPRARHPLNRLLRDTN